MPQRVQAHLPCLICFVLVLFSAGLSIELLCIVVILVTARMFTTMLSKKEFFGPDQIEVESALVDKTGLSSLWLNWVQFLEDPN